MDTDLNLLFGVLAMQLELIDSKQFAEACGIWSVDKSRPLAEILCEQKWLTSADRKIVDDLLQRKLRKHGGDPRETLGYEADMQAREVMRDAEQEDIDHTLSCLPPSIAHVRVGHVEETINYEPETRQRYTLTRVHGEGGVGRVWMAHDNRLNRHVALKEIRPDRQVNASSWQRFIKEAQVTGQLEHPNIVPVYEMTSGASENDETFYTMRFVNGRTLGAEITEYHRRKREGKDDRLQLRKLLQSFCGVCNALAYAHSRGVVHRDLKPANVMLGAFGEVVVLDWGLAKMVDHPDEDGESLDRSRVSISEEADAHQTIAGNILGTLTYMAPEQAAGRLQLIDRRTDVYGLGAILFAIVTGRHPHSSKNVNTEQIRQRIIQQPTPTAREIDPKVPKALSLICAKAMAKERKDRYQNAQELADDVQRWLGDEPIGVYRESIGERIGRLMRRYRTLTQGTGAALLVVAVVASIAFIVVRNARENERIAKAVAVRRFHEARETVDRYLTSTTDVLHYFPGARALRSRLMEQAALDYENFVSQDSEDPELRAETARAWGRLGDLRQLLGQPDKAEHAYMRGEAWLRDLIAESASPQSRMELAYCLSHRADLYRTEDKIDQARPLFAEALQLSADSSQVPSYRLMKGHVLYKQAQLEQRIGAFDVALDLLRQAEAYFQQLVALGDDPDHSEYRNWLAKSRSLQGQVYVELGQNAAAAKVIEQAIDEYGVLVAADPDSVTYLEGLAFSQINLANALRVLSREEEKQAALREAIQGFSDLLMTMPGVPVFRQNRAVAQASYGTSLNLFGLNVDAKEYLDQACFEFKELYGATGEPDFLHLLAASSVFRAQMYRDMDDNAEAQLILKNAITAYEDDLLIKYPRDVEYRRGLGVARRQMALLLYKNGLFAEAETEAQLALEAFDEALKLMPDDVYSMDGRAYAFEYLADALRARGELETAEAKFQQALAARDNLQQNPEFRLRLIKLLFKSTAPADLARSLQLATDLCQEFPESGEYLTALGAAQYLNGNFSAGIGTLQQVETKRVPQSSSHELWLALAFLGRAEDGDVERARAAFQLGTDRMQVAAPGHVELIELRRRIETALDDSTKT